MAEYDKDTLAYFGYTQEKICEERIQAENDMPYKVTTCPCRMCSNSDATCCVCFKVATTGKYLLHERLCAKCGWYCKDCIIKHPEYMVPEAWMFLTCKRC